MHHILRVPGRSAFRVSRVAAVLALAASIQSPTFAAPRPGVSDVMLARTALTAIDGDSQLRDVSIVVSVVDRVAVIGGSVAASEHGKRAGALVRHVTGIQDVKNRCFVQSQPDPLIRAVADRLNPRPTAHDLPGMVRPPRPMSIEDAYAPQTVIVAKPLPTPPVVTMKIASNTPLRPSLLGEPTVAPTGPRSISQPTVPTVSPVPGKLATTPVVAAVPVSVPTRTGDVIGRLNDLRKSEARFAGLTFDVRDGIVSLSGTSRNDSDVWDFAAVVRRVPGVNRVVVGIVNPR